MLKMGILNASHHLGSHRSEVDALNVFPVPDGDTGTNMSMTVAAAARELALLPDECGFDEAADRVASAMLRGARGNSGVILSLIFRGVARSVKGEKHIDGSALACALANGCEAAYKAVMKPTEGTILTVVRVAAQKAAESAQVKAFDAIAVFSDALSGAKDALAETPMMLAVLRQAGVVDAGGQGFVYIMEGLLHGFMGNVVGDKKLDLPYLEEKIPPRSAAARSRDEIQFAYCTEFLVERTPEASKRDTDELRLALCELGDCVVVVDDEDIVKVHVHSNEPGTVLCLAQQYGQFVQMKIENMRKQHQDARGGNGNGNGSENGGADKLQQTGEAWFEEQDRNHGAGGAALPPAEKRYGIVAVANGEGVTGLMGELGVDRIVNGGQSMNPSTEDILNAVNQTPAEHVFILPNNKNIIMAAEQVAPLTDRGVSVLRTKSVMQGIGAVLEFDAIASVEKNHMNMQRAAERVQTGLVTFAARDSSVEDLDIQKGSIIGLENGKLTVTEEDPVKAAFRVTRHLVRKYSGSIITVYAGEDVSDEQVRQLMEQLEQRYEGKVDISLVIGGQPLYYFMIAVE